MKYFGPECSRKAWEEPIGPLDMGYISTGGGAIMHYECSMRSVLGSSGHQLGKCGCVGGTQEDPVGLTKRQAAAHALHVWQRRGQA